MNRNSPPIPPRPDQDLSKLIVAITNNNIDIASDILSSTEAKNFINKAYRSYQPMKTYLW